jgi:hypothetical protein
MTRNTPVRLSGEYNDNHYSCRALTINCALHKLVFFPWAPHNRNCLSVHSVQRMYEPLLVAYLILISEAVAAPFTAVFADATIW